MISKRVTESNDSMCPTDTTHILYYNSAVTSHNTYLFERGTSDKVSYTATDIVIGDVSEDTRKQILDKLPIRAGDSMGLAELYKTAVSLHNEITENLDVEDGLVNGAVGVTKKISYTLCGIPVIVWIQFDAKETGQNLHLNSKLLHSHDINIKWTPFQIAKRQFTVGKYKNVKGSTDSNPDA